LDIKGKKILFLGDSITQGHGVSDINNIYWKRLEQDGCIVKGYGIGGTRIARQQLHKEPHDEKHFRTRIAEMDTDADVVVVFGGTNDYGHGDAAIGKITDRTDDTFYGALNNLYTDIINKFPHAQLVAMTPCHRLNENEYYNHLGTRCVLNLQGYVDIIIEVSGCYGIPVLDLYRVCGIQPDVEESRKLYMPDGLHPSDEGHKLIYQKLKGFLNSL